MGTETNISMPEVYPLYLNGSKQHFKIFILVYLFIFTTAHLCRDMKQVCRGK